LKVEIAKTALFFDVIKEFEEFEGLLAELVGIMDQDIICVWTVCLGRLPSRFVRT
jgi:hypothetical protein